MQTNSPSVFFVPLVGGHYRPPAKQVLAVMPTGALLALVPEPENPYDENALRVEVDPATVIPGELHEELYNSLQGTGVDLEELFAMPSLHLGYVGASDGKPCAKLGMQGNREVLKALAEGALRATLAFYETGAPLCKIEVLSAGAGE